MRSQMEKSDVRQHCNTAAEHTCSASTESLWWLFAGRAATVPPAQVCSVCRCDVDISSAFSLTNRRSMSERSVVLETASSITQHALLQLVLQRVCVCVCVHHNKSSSWLNAATIATILYIDLHMYIHNRSRKSPLALMPAVQYDSALILLAPLVYT
jgi:hypothetical protein